MRNLDDAEEVARRLLAESLPRRWAHTRGVAEKALELSGIVVDNEELVVAAAWLHDIGYSPALVITGFHPLDGARHLRDAEPASEPLCQLVAYHSGAATEAAARGLGNELAHEFRPPPAELADALTYCDMTTSPDGQATTIDDRIAEILARYGPGHVVSRSIMADAPRLKAVVDRLVQKLAGEGSRQDTELA